MHRSLQHLATLLFVLLLATNLSGCSVVRMGYDQAQTISYWWLDSYFDFTDSQELQVKNDLRELHHWHRTTQLPEYADILAAIGIRTMSDSTAASTCADVDKVRARFDTLVIHTVPYFARLVRQLSPSQLVHLRNKFASEDKSWREKWLDPTPEELAETRFDDWASRADSFYGDITDEQKTFMKNAIAKSVFNAQLSWEQRQERQQDILATFARISETGMGQSAAEAEIKGLIDRALDPRDPAYLAMYQKLILEACANLAGLHQLTSQKQRLRAQEKLAGYERDFRSLSGR